MKAATITAGDDEEFALIIRDPDTGLVTDMSAHTDWTVDLLFKGLVDEFTKSYTGGTLLTNTSHLDPDIPDGSIIVSLDTADTLNLSAGEYKLWVRVTDDLGELSTLFPGNFVLNIKSSPQN